MERLTRRTINGTADCAYCEIAAECTTCDLHKLQLEKLARYEDLEERGKLYVYGYAVVQEGENDYAIESGVHSITRENLFITKSEAEARMAELEEKK